MKESRKTRRQPRFIQGGIEKRQTGEGPCWFFRYRHMVDGVPQRTRIRLGLVSTYPTKADARRAAQRVRTELSEDEGRVAVQVRTFASVIARYKAEEMSKRHSTRRGYTAILDNHIVPRWGHMAMADIEPAEVRNWLRGMSYSPRYIGHMHALMRQLFKAAILWRWYPAGDNPMKLFSMPGSTKRQKQPQIITAQQFMALLEIVTYPYYRVMIVVAMGLGLRCSEITALRWRDVDFVGNRLHVRRGMVEGREDEVKTVHSAKSLPLHPTIGEELLRLRQWSEFNLNGQFVFASPWLGGELPFRSGNVQAKVLVPAGERIGLSFRLGWHTFRHSYKTLLDERGVSLTVQRDLMRHADVRTTAQVYGSVAMERLRDANSGLVEGILGEGKPQ